jgi:hypothetical protein
MRQARLQNLVRLLEDCLADVLTAVQVAMGKESTTLCSLVLPM